MYMMNLTEKIEEEVRREMEMFGNVKNEILADFDENKEIFGGGMQIISRLSDVQELIERGEDERARQEINIVKMLLIECVLETDESGRLK